MTSVVELDEAAMPLQRDLSCISLDNYLSAPSVSPPPKLRKAETAVSLSMYSSRYVSRGGDQRSSTAPRLHLLRRLTSATSLLLPSYPRPSAKTERLRRLQTTDLVTSASYGSGLQWAHGGETFRPRCSRCASAADLTDDQKETLLPCHLCLGDVPASETYTIESCRCVFCKECMTAYVTHEVRSGSVTVSCPAQQCPHSGKLSVDEVNSLVGAEVAHLYQRLLLNEEVEEDPDRCWCPKPGCETVCVRPPDIVGRRAQCKLCETEFCWECRGPFHRQGTPCLWLPEVMTLDDNIKCCPGCGILIERDAGCAQMMCKKCKHVFCWYCLTSLNEDFLLRHYDSGPCKDRLGHSRASVLWHRTQVVGVLIGLGIAVLAAAPVLIVIAPGLLCSGCVQARRKQSAKNQQELDRSQTSEDEFP